MKKSLLFKFVLLVFVFAGSMLSANAQVTTSSMTGIIKDAKGPLPGASVKAVHTLTGTAYTASTNGDGKFTISNMRSGGPYSVVVTFIGYQPQTFNDVFLQLGESYKLNTALQDNSVGLDEVKVVGNKGGLINKTKTGASTSVSRTQLEMLPTISRNINDFARLSPIAQVRNSTSDGSPMGISFGGQSTRYNQFTIDGANATDVFGLSANGTNGGQAGLNPIPFDAIDQVQVSLTPYDITQGGFTGGAMNAVTKSGTNELHGSAFGTYQNQDFVGKSISTRAKYTDFKNKQYGATLGGAIIKDKLFYFLAYEGVDRVQPIANQPGGPDGTSKIDVATAQTLKDFVANTYGYDVGSINGITNYRKSNSFLGRIDWNINDKNKLMIRENYLSGEYYNISSTASSMTFGNGGYAQNSKSNTVVAELSSKTSDNTSNLLRATWARIRDKRDPGSPFPSVTIMDAGATYRFGAEYSSQANSLAQDNITLTDNFNMYVGKHTFTIGTDNLFYKTENVFLQGLNGDYTFNSLAGFMSNNSQSALTRYQTTYSTDPGNPLAAATIKMAQFSLYAQDVFDIKENFKLTYGLRAELPVYLNDPIENPTFNSSAIAIANGVANNVPPKTKVILSPRIGFNWDVNSDGNTQVRGGAGIFTGRVPMVWVSNQYSNTGAATIKYSATDNAAVVSNGITFNPANPYQGTPTTTPATEIDVTDRNFQAPRNFKANLAIDQKLPWGLVGTIEAVYSKTIKDIAYKDLNLGTSQYTLDLGNGVTRPFYNSTKLDPRYTNVIYLTNTNKGYSYTVYGKLEKQFSQGWMSSLSYSLGHSYNLHDGTSSTAFSNYRFAYNINGLGNLDLARNNNDQGSRVTFMAGKKFTYAGGAMSTNIGLFYNGQSGQTLSYNVFGDLNGDDGSRTTSVSTSGSQDLMYIPTDASNFVPLTVNGVTYTGAQQFALFQDYVNSSDYLKENQGKNTKRNGTRLPWENHVDLKIMQDFKVYKNHTLSITADIFNIGNLISKKWGKAYNAGNQNLTPLTLNGFNTNGNIVTPKYQFNPNISSVDAYTGKPYTYSDYLSRWSMQIGARYKF
jgi:hypothetical protein